VAAALSRLATWDRHLCHAFNRLHSVTAWRRLFATCSRLGDGVLWYAVMASLPLLHGAAAWALVAAMVINGAALTATYRWLKARTRRLRPCEAHPGLLCSVAPLDRYSFPSGHTLHAVAFTSLITAHYPVWGWVLLPFTALVALSRLVLGLHYPSDVLAGAALGLGAAATTLVLVLPPPWLLTL